MRILHVISKPLDTPGGVEVYVRNLVHYLKTIGVESEIVTTGPNVKRDRTDISEGVKVHYIRCIGSLWGLNPIFNIIPFLQQNVGRFDLVHAHSYIFFSTIQAIAYSKWRKIPIVLTLHGGLQPIESENIAEKLKILFKTYVFDKVFGHVVVKMPDAVMSVSKFDLLSVGKIFNVKRTKNYWIPNAVNLERFDASSSQVRKYITFVGRLTTIKGFDLFLKIVEKVEQRIPGIPILIIGDGELLNSLEDAKKKLNITHHKKYPYENMSDVYNQSKVYVLSSRVEGLPTTLLEAMACKVPVVSTNVGGVPDVIEHGRNGLLYTPYEVETAAEYIRSLYANAGKQSEIGSNGRNLVENAFSWPAVVKKIFYVYKATIKYKKTRF